MCDDDDADKMEGGESDEEQEQLQERQHFASILRAFDHYRGWANAKVSRLERDMQRMSALHRGLVGAEAKIAAMREAIEANASVLAEVVAPHRAAVPADQLDDSRLQVLQDPDAPGGARFVPASRTRYVPEGDMSKVESTLKQFVREWGAEGAAERAEAHEPLLDGLRQALPGGGARGARVLVPGAGLGRLAWEVARLGFNTQASEFSYFMLIAANFLLNRTSAPVTVHPWVLQTCNVRSLAQQVRGAACPDTPPQELPPSAALSMCAGDFLEVYREQQSCWEAIVTCFFIDTAHDAVDYLERIRTLLVPGGAWVNIGPLLWHYHDVPGEVSIELSWEELRALIVAHGFVLEREEWKRCGYTKNPASMYQMAYECVFFVARWPAAAPPPPPPEEEMPPPPPGA